MILDGTLHDRGRLLTKMPITLDLLLTMLRCHLAALQSSAWAKDGSPSNGPALYLDEADTQAVIAELRRLQGELRMTRVSRC